MALPGFQVGSPAMSMGNAFFGSKKSCPDDPGSFVNPLRGRKIINDQFGSDSSAFGVGMVIGVSSSFCILWSFTSNTNMLPASITPPGGFSP